MFIITFDVFSQSETAFKYPLPKRLFIIDTILDNPEFIKADTAILSMKLKNLKILANQNNDEQSRLLYDYFN